MRWKLEAAPGRQRVSPGSSLAASERLPDELLARLVGSGDERPFRALYERHSQSLYRYCHSIVRNEADAHDALQSAFTKALTALREGRRSAPLRPWLYRIAHNEAVSIVRERGVAERRLEEVPLRSDAPSVEERASDRARLSSLLHDLSQLSDRARGALVMRELGGLSHEEIAAALGLSVGAAKQAIFEARKGLMELAEGRAMRCDDVMRRLSDGDGRAFRGRRVRAHLQDCRACASFAAAIPRRRAELRALAPVLPPVAATALLERVLAGARTHGGSLGEAASQAARGAAPNGAGSAGSGSGSAGAAGSSSVSAGAAGSSSVSAGAAGSSSVSAGATGSTAAGGLGLAGGSGGMTAGLVAKAVATVLAPKALLGVAVSAGIAAGGLALGISPGQPAHRPAPASQTAGPKGASGHATTSHSTAPAQGAARSTKGTAVSTKGPGGPPQPAAGARRPQWTGATRCSNCGSPPGTRGKAPASRSSDSAPGVGWARPDGPPAAASSRSAARASHPTRAASHSAAAAQHASQLRAGRANPRSSAQGGSQLNTHPTSSLAPQARRPDQQLAHAPS